MRSVVLSPVRLPSWSTLIFFAAMAVLGGAGTASAETAEQEVERLGAEAAQSYKAGKFDRSVALLTRAYAIRPVAALLYNLAKSYEKLTQEPQACDAYRRYAEGGASNDAKLMSRANERIAECDKNHVPSLNAPPPPPPPPVEVKPAGPTPAELEAAAQKAALEKKRIEDLAAAEAAQKAAAERRSQRHRLLAAGVVVAIVGLGGVGAGVGLWSSANGLHSQFAASMDETTERSLRGSAQQMGLYSTVAYAVGGVVLAASLPLLALGLRGDKAEHAPAGAAPPTALPIIVPVVGPSLAGALASWKF